MQKSVTLVYVFSVFSIFYCIFGSLVLAYIYTYLLLKLTRSCLLFWLYIGTVYCFCTTLTCFISQGTVVPAVDYWNMNKWWWWCTFYIHGSVNCESNLIIVQQDATVFSLLYFCRQLYMFRVLTHIIKSSYICTSSWWCVSTPRTCRAAYRYIINWIQSHLVGQLLNLNLIYVHYSIQVN